jgi:anti-anti-sigma factor
MEGGLSVEIAQFKGEVVISLSGEADLAAVEQLRDAIEPHLSPHQTIALDLSGLTFLDSHVVTAWHEHHHGNPGPNRFPSP